MEFQENLTTELKQEITEGLLKEVIAFANTNGGTIYVGVDDNGDLVGLTETFQKQEAVLNKIRDSISPDLTLYTEMEIMEQDGKEFLAVKVQEGIKKPYHLIAKGLKPSGVYVRHGTSSVPAQEETIRSLIRETDGTIFEKCRCFQQEITFDYASAIFLKHEMELGEPQKKTLGLQDMDGYFTHAGLLLSDQCPHIIRCGIYDGVTKEKFHKRLEFGGSILKQLEDAYAALDLINPLASHFEGLYRKDTQGYPPQALREALVNAIVHRDYDFSGPILIHVHDDRIEIVSLGGLVKGLPIEALHSHISQPRNPILANVFFRLELIESYGTGISRMKENYADFHLSPTFSVTEGSFCVTLPNKAVKNTLS